MQSCHVNDPRALFGENPDWPFEILAYLPAGRIVDVGAASGAVTMAVLRKSPQSKVAAFEPFPGNWPHFERTCGNDARIRLIKKAASDSAGKSFFRVSSTVQGNEKGWEQYKGYSSLGRLTQRADDTTMTVETSRVDREVSEHIRFLKIDVQGAEYEVLKGCQDLLDQGKIDLVYLEFDGKDTEAAGHLSNHGFICFDNLYCIVRRDGDTTTPLNGWKVVGQRVNSTGRVVLKAWPLGHPRSLEACAGWLRDQRKLFRNAFTDLFFVRERFLPEFLRAAAEMRAAEFRTAAEAANS